jgi:hypothetical protein
VRHEGEDRRQSWADRLDLNRARFRTAELKGVRHEGEDRRESRPDELHLT